MVREAAHTPPLSPLPFSRSPHHPTSAPTSPNQATPPQRSDDTPPAPPSAPTTPQPRFASPSLPPSYLPRWIREAYARLEKEQAGSLEGSHGGGGGGGGGGSRSRDGGDAAPHPTLNPRVGSYVPPDAATQPAGISGRFLCPLRGTAPDFVASPGRTVFGGGAVCDARFTTR